MKKLPHEMLRDGADRAEKEGCLYNFSIGNEYIASPTAKEARRIADVIEKYYIPRPRFEDGEPVQFGDEVEDGTIREIAFLDDGTIILLDETPETIYEASAGWFIKRPAPKVLDADGVEIKAGENRFSIEHGYEVIVNQVNPDYCICSQLGNGCTLGSSGYKPSDLTHREPDSLSKFRDDLENKYGKESSWVKRLTAIMERDA